MGCGRLGVAIVWVVAVGCYASHAREDLRARVPRPLVLDAGASARDAGTRDAAAALPEPLPIVPPGWSCPVTAAACAACAQPFEPPTSDRAWRCSEAGGIATCRSTTIEPPLPALDAWTCTASDGAVHCERALSALPDDRPWSCRLTERERACNAQSGTPMRRSTPCLAGTRRWCSDAVYDMGSQTCDADGTWGPCREPSVTRDGLAERPATACGCRHFYYYEDCCEDQLDRDCDGRADCLIPTDWAEPECASDGSLCSFCDTHEECGGPNDYCLFATVGGHPGYAFCARDCSDTPCPDGYQCQEIGMPDGAIHQCVPTAGTCD